MSDLRLCDHAGCLWIGQHAENCPTCFGWGTAFATSGDGWVLSASDLADWQPEWQAVACPECRGTPMGPASPYRSTSQPVDLLAPLTVVAIDVVVPADPE